MNILFVHQNLPAQFVHLAPALIGRGHKVTGLTASTNTLNIPYPVARYGWKPRNFDPNVFELATTYAEMINRARIVAEAAQELKERANLQPDLIVSNPGWGESILLKEVWPEAHHLVYAEFFYRTHGLDTDFDPELQKQDLKMHLWITSRQAHLLHAFHSADSLIVPTEWQKKVLPHYIQPMTSVIHDGVDTQRIRPAEGKMSVTIPGTSLKFQTGDEVLTFVNRNLEPYRGYHIFMRALPQVLRERPNAQVVIVGGDDRSYSPRAPAGTTWKQMYLDEVKDRIDLSRVHFVGRVPYATLNDLMRVTRVHTYFTYPFVLSWSMLEAMAAGALVVGSRTPPVEEIIEDGVNGRLVDFFDVDGLARTLIETLANPRAFDGLRQKARQTIVERYDLKSRCLPRLIDLVERCGKLDKTAAIA